MTWRNDMTFRRNVHRWLWFKMHRIDEWVVTSASATKLGLDRDWVYNALEFVYGPVLCFVTRDHDFTDGNYKGDRWCAFCSKLALKDLDE